MKYICLLYLVLLSFSGLAQKKPTPRTPPKRSAAPLRLAPIDEYFGFRDVRLESDISAHPEMKRVVGQDTANSNLDKVIYERPGEDLKIGEIKATAIEYVYYKGKLSRVLVLVDGYLDRIKLLAALRAKYGQPVQAPDAEDAEDPEGESFLWRGKKADLILAKMDEARVAAMLLVSKCMGGIEEADDNRKAAAGL